MKSIFFFLLVLSPFAKSFCQDGPLTKGQLRINAGIGIISYIKIAGGTTTFPPLTLSAEYAISEDMTLGAVVGHTATEQVYNYSYSKDTYKFSHTLLGVKANYYFNVNPKYELYTGAFLGYNAVKASVTSNSSSAYYTGTIDDGGGVLYGFQVGGRYRFTPFTSCFAEIGYGIAVLNLGLTFQLGKNK